jgi:uncharacterized protein YjgD (DUF1641 family)
MEINQTESPVVPKEELPATVEQTAPATEELPTQEEQPTPEPEPSPKQPEPTITALEPAETNFFSELYKLLYHGVDLTLTFRRDQEAGKLVVGVRPTFFKISEGHTINNLKPIVLTHFIEQLDKSFFMTIMAPVQRAVDTAKSLKEWDEDLDKIKEKKASTPPPSKPAAPAKPAPKAKTKTKPAAAKKPAPPKVDKKALAAERQAKAEEIMKEARITTDPTAAIAKAKEAKAAMKGFEVKALVKEIESFVKEKEKAKKEADRKVKLDGIYAEASDMFNSAQEKFRLEDYQPAIGISQNALKLINGHQEERFLTLAKNVRELIKRVEGIQNRSALEPKIVEAKRYMASLNFPEAMKIVKAVFKADPENPGALEIKKEIVDKFGQATYDGLYNNAK